MLFFEKREEREDFSIFGRIPMLSVKKDRGDRIGTPMGSLVSIEKMSRKECIKTRKDRDKLNFKFLEKNRIKRKIIITKNIEWVYS